MIEQPPLSTELLILGKSPLRAGEASVGTSGRVSDSSGGSIKGATITAKTLTIHPGLLLMQQLPNIGISQPTNEKEKPNA